MTNQIPHYHVIENYNYKLRARHPSATKTPSNPTFNRCLGKHSHSEPPTVRMEPAWMCQHRDSGETGMSVLSLMCEYSIRLHPAIAGPPSARPTDGTKPPRRGATSKEFEKSSTAHSRHLFSPLLEVWRQLLQSPSRDWLHS